MVAFSGGDDLIVLGWAESTRASVRAASEHTLGYNSGRVFVASGSTIDQARYRLRLQGLDSTY